MVTEVIAEVHTVFLAMGLPASTNVDVANGLASVDVSVEAEGKRVSIHSRRLSSCLSHMCHKRPAILEVSETCHP